MKWQWFDGLNGLALKGWRAGVPQQHRGVAHWAIAGMVGLMWTLPIVTADAHQAIPSSDESLAQIPDHLWDLIPPEIIPPEIIPDGDFFEFLQQTGDILQTVSDRRGQYALITAAALANDDPGLLSWLSQLQSSPIGAMSISGWELNDFTDQLTTSISARDAAIDAIAQQAHQESASSNNRVDFASLPDLRQSGPMAVMTVTVDGGPHIEAPENGESNPTERINRGSVDLYLPQLSLDDHAAPVIVISHGVGGSRTHFKALAHHLASYGFVVVVPDHLIATAGHSESEPNPESAALSQPFTAQLTALGERLFGVLSPAEFIQRPLTISGLLDELEHLNTVDPRLMGRLDTDNVGIIGHSLGGYTGLAMASGELNRRQLKRTCKDEEALAANLSLLLQCQAQELPRRTPSLEDSRVKAVMALNPVLSAVLGKSQIADIDVPVMIVTGSHDAIAPMVSEQLPAFSWLTTDHKYLATLVPGGHASVNISSASESAGLSQLVTGPANVLGADATQALSVAFMQTHLGLTTLASSKVYLSATYGKFVSEDGMTLHLVTELDGWDN